MDPVIQEPLFEMWGAQQDCLSAAAKLVQANLPQRAISTFPKLSADEKFKDSFLRIKTVNFITTG